MALPSATLQRSLFSHGSVVCLCGHADRCTTADENEAAGVEPLGGLAASTPAKASAPVPWRSIFKGVIMSLRHTTADENLRLESSL